MHVTRIDFNRSPHGYRVLVLRTASQRHRVSVRDRYVEPDPHSSESSPHTAHNNGQSGDYWRWREFTTFYKRFIHRRNESLHLSVAEEGTIRWELWELWKFVRVYCR